MAGKFCVLGPRRARAGAVLLLMIWRLCHVSADIEIHRSRASEGIDKWQLQVVACTPHGTTVTFIIQEFGQVRSERSTLTPGESASFEIVEENVNDWTCIAKFTLLNSTTRYFKEFPLRGPHGPKCSTCRWIFKDYQSGIFLDSNDGRGPVHILDWDVDVDTSKQFSSRRD